ncbi:MAG: TetR/AcrR family transcriptional regulator [Leptolyngbya sp. SIO1E4]|nr:TetR/AcrR family transcriptional regulator [Leptolyngbya sp. SIO1E4]
MVTKKIRGRGRPRGFDVDKGLAIARQLFHQRGFDGVGVAELSQKMGITAPSLYSAFGSKCELFERVLEKYVAEKSGWLVSTLQEENSVNATIAKLFKRASEVYTADATQLGCLVLDGARNCNDAKACELSAKFRQATWQMLCDHIAKEHTQKAPMLASYVLTILMGLSAAARDGLSESELQTIGEIAAHGFEVHVAQTT